MKQLPVGGSGGKGGGGGSGISEDPDTLSSVAIARIVDLVGEGPIVGLVNGEYSIYIDGVPLRDLSGTPNYRPFTWQSVPGTQSQLPIPGFSGTEQENSVGLRVFKTMGKVIRSVPDGTADAVRVTVAVQGLTETTTEGKVKGSSVRYAIYARVVAGAWTVAYEGAITGKTGARYQRSHEVRLSQLGPGPYEVAVERLSDDAVSSLVVNPLYWDTYTIINYELFSYPNSALIAVAIDGRYFSQVPKREYHVKGLIVRVPTNYDPVTRTYATTGPGTTNGGWDGTFKSAYTNNPAWCFYDLVTHPRYGLGSRISDSQISKWEMYQIAKYCDELVPSGLTTNVFDYRNSGGLSSGGASRAPVPVANGPMEPRFTLNVVINTADDAYRVINNLSSVFRGMAYWASGLVALTQDRPTSPSWVWVNANTEDGLFHYEGSSRAQRHTVAVVGWNDPTEGFTQKFEYVEDREGIDRYGVRPIELVAFGCTSRGQARRVGLWLLYTERVEKGAVRFKIGAEGGRVKPGEVGKVLDANRAGARWGGRIASATTTHITMDAPVTLTPATYQMTVVLKDGTLAERNVVIASNGSYTVLPLASPLPSAPATMAIWTLSSPSLSETLVRVVSVRPDGAGYEIVALEHEPSKYDAIELGLSIEELPHSLLSMSGVYQVTNLTLTETTYRPSQDVDVQVSVVVSWNPPAGAPVRGYTLRAVNSAGQVSELPETSDTSITFTNVPAETYVVEVRVIDVLGRAGPPVTASITVDGIDEIPPGDVVGLGGVVVASGVRVSWDSCEDKDYADTELRLGTDWETGTLLFRGKTNYWIALNPPPDVYTLWAKHRDISGNLSENATQLTYEVVLGVDPDGPPLVRLTSTGQVFITPANSTTPAPASVTLTATIQNIPSPAYEWLVDGVVQVGATAATFVVNSFTAGSAKQIRVNVTGSGAESAFDIMSIFSLKEGSDALAAGLDNENQSIPCDASGTPTGGLPVTTTMVVARGSTFLTSPAVSFSIVESIGIESAGTTNGASAHVTINSATGLVTVTQIFSDSASVKIRATIGSTTIDKVLTLSKSKAGSSASIMSIEANVDAIRRNKDGSHLPQTLSWTVYQTNSSGKNVVPGFWRFYRGTGTVAYIWSLFSSDSNSGGSYSGTMTPYVAFKLELYADSGYSVLLDVVTIPILVDGADTLNVVLTNEAHVVPADANGNVTSYAGAETQVKAYLGAVDVTASCSITKNDNNLTTTLTGVGGATPTVTTTLVSGDAGFTDILVTYGSYPTVTKRFSVTKSKQGQTGTGTRGSLKGNGSQYGISTAIWVDGLANRVIDNMLTGNNAVSSLGTTSHLRIGDTVALGNGTNFTEERFWSGAAWLLPGTVISGNLLVGGTISGQVNLNITGYARVEGANSYSVPMSGGTPNITTALLANSSGNSQYGVVGQSVTGGAAGVYGANTSNASNTSGVLGYSPNFGVAGFGNQAGLHGFGLVSSANGVQGFAPISAGGGAGVLASNGFNTANVALRVNGKSEFNGVITSNVAVGTAPLIVSSTTVVENLNAGMLRGAQWATPLAIGNITPNAGTFTSMTVNSLRINQTPSGGVAGNTANFSGIKPGGGIGTNSWVLVNINGVNKWFPCWDA